MTLARAAASILGQLADLINQIDPSDFSRPSQSLSGSTIGQHIRHTLEFFTCFQEGCITGVVNYDKRGHDPLIQADCKVAAIVIARVITFVNNLKDDAPIVLEVRYDPAEEACHRVSTNIFRELVYNIEHAVHHMAMIKIAIREVAPYVVLPGNFGIAASTLRHGQRSNAITAR